MKTDSGKSGINGIALSSYATSAMVRAPRAHFEDHRLFLANESRALLARLNHVQPFPLHMPMVAAANISPAAQRAIFDLLHRSYAELKMKIQRYLAVIQKMEPTEPSDSQCAFSLIKLKFNWLLDSLDIFSDVLTQRSEHETGVLLAGLDALAEDALQVERPLFQAPPLVIYLDRGHGAAIRRARTRLPSGKLNPVAVIRVPRERMISSGIAASLLHEVGHQGATALNLVRSLKVQLRGRGEEDPSRSEQWQWYERWISEIISDLWAVAYLGIGATMGLINVVSVPSYFVFRLNPDDPHPPPWIRVKMSLAFGEALFPDPQWQRLSHLWDRLYPLTLVGESKRATYKQLAALLPEVCKTVLQHRSAALKERMLKDVFPARTRQPASLRALFRSWNNDVAEMKRYRPSHVFAAIGQARADNILTPERENDILKKMLVSWALKRAIS
jgi:hypothetical protein